MLDWEKITYFSRDEFGYAGDVEPDPELVHMLDVARSHATYHASRDIPFRISEGGGIRPLTGDFRRDSSAHTTGHAADIAVADSVNRFYILEALIFVGFRRIGVYDRHIHVDTSPNHAPCVVWTGISQ